MAKIHPTAVIDPKSRIGDNVRIGAYSVVEAGTVIGDNTRIMDHVHIGENTLIGSDNIIYTGAVLGQDGQFRGSDKIRSGVEIGSHNTFREYTTIHRGSKEGSFTHIGSHNYFMVNSHVAHDCLIGNHITMANSSVLGGHVTVEDHANLSAYVAIHQFCRIGSFAMIGANFAITQDVPPYMLINSNDGKVGSINIIGLKRSNMSESVIREIKRAYRTLYLSDQVRAEALETITKECESLEVQALVHFIRGSKRGILPHRKGERINSVSR